MKTRRASAAAARPSPRAEGDLEFPVFARAPLRIDFAGGFTDVPPFCEEEGGFVVNAAISAFALAAVMPLPRGAAKRVLGRVAWDGTKLEEDDDGDSRIDARDPLAPLRAVLRASGLERVALRVRTELPAASGLGSSGAAIVAALAAVGAASRHASRRVDLARRARAIEVDELGLLGGGQDPIAAALGGVHAISFGPGSRDGKPKRLRPSRSFRSWLQSSLVIAHVGHRRSSSPRIEAVVAKMRARDRKALSCLRAMRSAAHELAVAIEGEDPRTVVSAFESHNEAMRELDPGIFGNRVADAIDAGVDAGAFSGKPSGAGGGGCVVLLARPERVPRVQAALRETGCA
ncbi:MAG TPA: hypothetical protein VKE69_13970, partial [Planctomycetota bacterium]|nr:hypothetical protein [Planctomycetota bacterium]